MTLEMPSATNCPSAKEGELPRLLVAVRDYPNRLVEHAVLLQIPTATRPGETRGARWEEFDVERGVWTIPAAPMKHAEERGDHGVPLSTHAQHVLRSLRAITGHRPVLFPSRSRWNVPMSQGAVLMVLQRGKFAHITAHGFRSLFSTTCHEHGHESAIIG
jgi:integrase